MRKLGLVLVCLAAACGDDSTGGPAGGDNHLKTVIATLKVGEPKGAYAFDLDGDGAKDDGLAGIAGALESTSSVDVQAGIDTAIAGGATVLLIELSSDDSAFENDAAATLTISRGLTQASPDFSGNGSFTVDSASASLTLTGPIANGIFTSPAPTGAPAPLSVVLGFGDDTVALPVIDVLVSVKIDAAAKKLSAGKLGGAITQDAFNAAIYPLLVVQYNALIASDPNGSSTLLVLSVFDQGGCDGGIADNRTIELCELEDNVFFASAIKADVNLLDTNGNLAPSRDGPKDAISLGVGFSGVGASF